MIEIVKHDSKKVRKWRDDDNYQDGKIMTPI